MYDDIIELIGAENGLTSMILVGVHGNEKCGVEAIKKIIQSLKIQKGKVFIAYGNPKAIKENVRFTETNLNRMFKEGKLISEKDKKNYEYRRAKFLKKYMDQVDVLLDIHASFTPKSQRFIICEKNAYDIVKYLPSEIIVSGFDKIEPGGTDYYMNKNGKIGICVECGYLGDTQSSQVAEASILSFLSAQGHINNELKIYNQLYIDMYKLYTSETESFRLSKIFEDFEKIEVDQLIGMDGQREVRASRDSIILFAKNTNKIGDEVFLLGKIKSSD